MVFAFFCQNVASTPCRILQSCMFGEDMHVAYSQGTPNEGLRELRKEQLMQVACRVQSEYNFRTSSKIRVSKQRDESDNSCEKGHFRLPAGDPFSTVKTVIWMVCENCAFVMICNQDENRLQAENVLSIIVKYSHDYILEQNMTDILMKGERIATILQLYLPNGQIIFLNNKVVKQLEKQLETLLSAK